jgi:hypothetical protein
LLLLIYYAILTTHSFTLSGVHYSMSHRKGKAKRGDVGIAHQPTFKSS